MKSENEGKQDNSFRFFQVPITDIFSSTWNMFLIQERRCFGGQAYFKHNTIVYNELPLQSQRVQYIKWIMINDDFLEY